jgi:threonine synthase
MKYVSTRDPSHEVSLSSAIAAGLAPDGGLYVPAGFPHLRLERGSSLRESAKRLLAPFFEADPLRAGLDAIIDEAFDFEAPLRRMASGSFILELFHGPTAAFKDFGARFLAAAMSRMRAEEAKPFTVLVATSGDTGAAVAAAFHRKRGVRVVILYPDGRVSPRQAHQLGCFGDNVAAFRVAGSFDDCQALVKRALGDPSVSADLALTSANSISLGRLLPQMAYYAYACSSAPGGELNFVIPTGNLGNAFAALLARASGIRIGRIVLATNANAVIPSYFERNVYEPAASVATLANAMDVGAPSNFERLLWLFERRPELRESVDARSVSDEAIRQTIRNHAKKWNEVLCPHTATAAFVLDALREQGEEGEWAIASTAHPSKFETVVEPLIETSVDLPASLSNLLARESHAAPLANDYEAFVQALHHL